MANIAGIDVGSNAIRLVVAEVRNDQTFSVISNSREPIRLGKDVFSLGEISQSNFDRCIDAFKRFKETIGSYRVVKYRAVATSAVRDAKNQKLFLKKLREASGIGLEVIDGQEEARLSALAVSKTTNLNKSALLVDIGGGSIELSLTLDGQVIFNDSLNMGTVRFLQILDKKKRGVDILKRLSSSYASGLRRRIKKVVGKKEVSVVAATGGTVDTLGNIGKEFFGEKDSSRIKSETLAVIYEQMTKLSLDERISKYALKADRADVIIPALIVLSQAVKYSKNKEIVVPNVGVKEGILYDLIDAGIEFKKERLSREKLLSFSTEIGRRFSFDEDHALYVSSLSMQIFDKTQKVHGLSRDYRTLLEVAALLHDVGNQINSNSHHKHSQYIINSVDFVGLTKIQKQTVGSIARYHRKSTPKMEHVEFASLPEREREAVVVLSAILRVAEGIASEESSKQVNLRFYIKEKKALLKVEAKGDVTLEKLAILERIKPLEEALKLKLLVR